MSKLIKYLSRQKYRFDIGQSCLAIFNLSFVILAASDKITSLVGLPAKILVPILVPLTILIVWGIGYFLDRVNFAQAYQAEQNRRNEMLTAIHNTTRT